MTNRKIMQGLTEITELINAFITFDSRARESIMDSAYDWAYDDGRDWDNLSDIDCAYYIARGVDDYNTYMENEYLSRVED